MKATEDLEGAGGQVLKDPVLLVGGPKGRSLLSIPTPGPHVPTSGSPTCWNPWSRRSGTAPRWATTSSPGGSRY